ncbi:MAG: acyl-CoA dehydratase activase [Promethearchaeota archaeon]
MVFAGIDVGSLTGKCVLLEGGEIKAHKVIRVKKTPVITAETVFNECLLDSNIHKEDIKFLVSTGYGRDNIPFSDKSVTEITCHGVGAHFLLPSVRTIIDIGGQDCKIIAVDRTGKLADFVMNEKCSAGTGRYLEIMADLLHVSLTELGTISLKSKTPINIKSTCSIYAQAEVLQYISSGFKKPNIAAGINKAMAERVFSMAKRVKILPDIVISGGVAKNIGVARHLEEMIREQLAKASSLKHSPFLKMPIDPQIVGALGAAVIASQRYKRA